MLAAISLAAAACASAQDVLTEPGGEGEAEVALEGRIPVKIVGGRLVAQVEISTIYNRIEANVFIDFDAPCGLRLDDSAAVAIKAETPFGATTPVSVHFPSFAVTVERREPGVREQYSEFTRLYSNQINERALAGTIGANILKNYRVTFDLHAGVIELQLPDKKEAGAGAEDGAAVGGPAPELADPDDPDQGPIEVSITKTNTTIWLPVRTPGGRVQAMAVATSRYDSLIDKAWCDELGFPAGDVSPLVLDTLDLSKFVAFRPEEIVYEHPDGPVGVIGLNLLKHLRLTIDRQNNTATYEVTAPAEFPEADRGFFKAMVTEDADQLETWLEQYQKERLGPEAADLLLGYRIDEAAEPEQFHKAIRLLAGTWREDMVSTLGLDAMRELRAAGYPMHAILAGELGLEGGRTDRYPNSVHRLHAAMGDILLEQNEDKRAWRHLLSAAFGLPQDGMINLKLGEYYERQERHKRALSRYLQAVLSVEAGEQAIAGLHRMQELTGSTERMSVDTIARLIAGRTYNYAAATRYRPEPDSETNRVALVEFFTSAHIKDPDKEEGSIGGTLGNEGVMTYFPRGKVAMLTYHLPSSGSPLDSLANEACQRAALTYGTGSAVGKEIAPVQIVNGVRRFTGYGHVQDAEDIYRAGRDMVLAELAEKSEFDLELTASVTGDKLAGTLVVKGPPGANARVEIVLAERGVLYPGKNKVVIQRMVARSALIDEPLGQRFEPEDGVMNLKFSRSLKAITEANIEYLKRLQASGWGAAQTFAAKMDPRQLTVVAFVRDGNSDKVLQAIQINPNLGDEKP